jgi:hypothetical protein
MSEELRSALKAISRALDGTPDTETIYGCQVLLEALAGAPERPITLPLSA